MCCFLCSRGFYHLKKALRRISYWLSFAFSFTLAILICHKKELTHWVCPLSDRIYWEESTRTSRTFLLGDNNSTVNKKVYKILLSWIKCEETCYSDVIMKVSNAQKKP